MTVLLLVALLLCAAVFATLLELDSSACGPWMVFRHDPFIVKDIRDLIREVINGW